MKALILAAGYGIRLYPLVKNTPKALLEIQGWPLIHYICDKLNGLKGLDETLIVTNDKFYTHFVQWVEQQKKDCSFKLTVVNDGTLTPETRLGSIGDIDFVLKQGLVKDDLLVIGGDNLFDESLQGFIQSAGKNPSSVTIGLFAIDSLEEAKKFGVVKTDAKGKITLFEEKPANPSSTLIAMCLYFFPKKTLGFISDYLVESQKSDRAGDYIQWLQEHHGVYGFTFHGGWFDIGSIESYQDAQANFKVNKPKAKKGGLK
jgi:glucose-1-phosphate thymidylyltransferase